MRTRTVTPEFAAALRSLAETQLQMQASRSGTLDARAVGVIGVDVAIASIIVGPGLGQGLRAVVLAMLAISAGLAGRSVSLGGSEGIGPSVVELLASTAIDDREALEGSLLNSLAADVRANDQALSRKAPRLTAAFVLLAFTVGIVLIGGIY